MEKIEREIHGYNILTGFIVGLQVAILFLGFDLIKKVIMKNIAPTDLIDFGFFLLAVALWLLGEFLIGKLYLKKYKKPKKY
jgi:hypothetical protein